jgi:hypothetical protein
MAFLALGLTINLTCGEWFVRLVNSFKFTVPWETRLAISSVIKHLFSERRKAEQSKLARPSAGGW